MDEEMRAIAESEWPELMAAKKARGLRRITDRARSECSATRLERLWRLGCLDRGVCRVRRAAQEFGPRFVLFNRIPQILRAT